MKGQRALLSMLTVLFLSNLAFASTVTLTGSCPKNFVGALGGNITFNIINSGNGTATDLLIEPFVSGISISNSSAYIQYMSPGINYTSSFHLSNASLNGSYLINFVTSYSQDTSSYSTLFPCLVYVGVQANGPLSVTSRFAEGKVTANVSNGANEAIIANVAAVAPQGFQVQSPTMTVSIAAYSNASESFNVTTPNYTAASFPVLTEVSYVYQGDHYSALGEAAVSFGASSSNGSGSSGGIGAITIVFLIIMAILLVLIVVSFVVRKRGSGRKHEGTIQ